MPRDPQREAFERLGGRYEVRVLEPSPPAVHRPPWFADDPTTRGDVAPGRLVVSPVGSGDLRWDDLCRGDPDLAAWCGARWLGAWPRLPELPSPLAATVEALRTVAEHVLAPLRFEAVGKVGLRYTMAGFGTPFFGDDQQVRVEDGDLVREDGSRAELTTLGEAAGFAGVAPGAARGVLVTDVPFAADLDVQVDLAAARFAGEWLGFAASALEEARAASRDRVVTRLQLMPDSFELAFDRGHERFTSLGAALDPPHLFVRPWRGQERRLDLPAIAAAADERAAAVAFLAGDGGATAPTT